MAKRQPVHPIHMHVPTKIGFTIVGIAVMVYGLFLASSYTASKQADTLQSHAATIPGGGGSANASHKCRGKGWTGTCIDTHKPHHNSCPNGFVGGKCSGPPWILCCPYD